MRIDREWTVDAAERACITEAFSPCHMNHSASRHNVVRSVNRVAQRVSFFAGRDIQVELAPVVLIKYNRFITHNLEDIQVELAPVFMLMYSGLTIFNLEVALLDAVCSM